MSATASEIKAVRNELAAWLTIERPDAVRFRGWCVVRDLDALLIDYRPNGAMLRLLADDVAELRRAARADSPSGPSA